MKLLFLSFGILIVSCGPMKSDKSVQAPAGIRASFLASTVAEPALKADKAKISIQKSSLEKEFLFQAQMIFQNTAPQFRGTQSRVVVFRQRSDKLYLIDATGGSSFVKNLPQTLVLAQFDVISQNDTSITFDFNSGMSRLFVEGDWRVHDFQGSLPDSSLSSLNTSFSYIEEAKFTEANNLMIRQIAQVEIAKNEHKSLEVRYYLSPYVSHPMFKPTESPRTFDRMGFFEVSPRFNDQGGTVIYATKRDISKPVVYAISSNTPSDFKAAMKEGVLYWNKVLGKDLIQVIDAPAGLSAPDGEYNIIQWVDWDSAGFAYADAQMDPRTGEILHQQIYMTSAWALIGKSRMRSYFRQATLGSSQYYRDFGLQGFGLQKLCDLDINKDVVSNLSILAGEDPAKILKATQDLIRLVVAHEVGHTLGLRHNFAGSASANFNVSERDQLFKDYLKTGSVKEGLVISSSVMDYLPSMEEMMMGDQIAKGTAVGEYDRKALKALYEGEKFKPADLPLFCTDSGNSAYGDCQVFDVGNSYTEWVKYSLHQGLELLPWNLLDRYIEAKNPLYGSRPILVEEVSLPVEASAAMLLSPEIGALKMFTKSGKLLKVSREFPYNGDVNTEEVRAKTVEELATEMSRVGGLSSIFLNADNKTLDKEMAQFDSMLSDPKYIKGVGADGKPYEFTTAELMVMRQNAKQFFANLKKALIKDEAKVLSGQSLQDLLGIKTPVGSPASAPADDKFDQTKLTAMLADYLAERAQNYLLESTGEILHYQRVSSAVVSKDETAENIAAAVKRSAENLNLPVCSYPLEVRKLAAGFLNPSRAEDSNWSFSQRVELQKKYRKMMLQAFSELSDSDEFLKKSVLEDYPGAAMKWLWETANLYKMLQ